MSQQAQSSLVKGELSPEILELIGVKEIVDRNGDIRKIDVMGTGSRSTLNNLRAIYGLMHRHQPTRTLEIGLAEGTSAITFIVAHKELGHKAEGQHFAIDPFQATMCKDSALIQLKNANLDNYLTFYQEYSAFRLPQLIKEGLKFDMIYVDGSHFFEDVFVDIYFCAKILEKGGILLLDDCSDPQVAKVVKYILKNMTKFFRQVDTTEIIARKGMNNIKYQLAKQLGKVQLKTFEKITEEITGTHSGNFNDF